MRESAIEKAFRSWCKEANHLCLKSEVISKGFPDRMVILSSGEVVYLEFKTKRGRLSPHQKYWIEELESRGQRVCVPRSVDEAINYVNSR